MKEKFIPIFLYKMLKILSFFCVFICCFAFCNAILIKKQNYNIVFVYAYKCENPKANYIITESNNIKVANNTVFELLYNNIKFDFGLEALYRCGEKHQELKNKYAGINDFDFKINLAKKIHSMGFDEKTAMCYSFYGLKSKIKEIVEEIEYPAQNSEMKFNAKLNYLYVSSPSSGLSVNQDKLYKDLYNFLFSEKKVFIECNVVRPTINKEDVPLYFKGGFYTTFSSSSMDRRHNIARAVEQISGTILLPNEEFSFNKVVGVRSEENGFKMAKIIVNGEYVDGFGGGVCQVSTTLYNAVILSGLKVLESHSHSLKPSYVELGFDAMVNYGSCDLRFVNNTDKAIGIIGKVEGDRCRFDVYGVKNQYNYLRKNEVIKTLPKKETEYILDSSNANLYGILPLGEKKIVSLGHDGVIVDSYIEVYEKNKKVKREKLRNSIYNPTGGKVVVGTGLYYGQNA